MRAGCSLRRLSLSSHTKFSGGHTGGVTPDPIPNSEVKASWADGTAGDTLWESKSPPELFFVDTALHESVGLFALCKYAGPAAPFEVQGRSFVLPIEERGFGVTINVGIDVCFTVSQR